MRIAQVAPLYESVPPKLYGGTERVVSYLTEELIQLGHDVIPHLRAISIAKSTPFSGQIRPTKARYLPASE